MLCHLVKKEKRKNRIFINKIPYSILFCLYPLMYYHVHLFIYIPNAQLFHGNSKGGHGRDLLFFISALPANSLHDSSTKIHFTGGPPLMFSPSVLHLIHFLQSQYLSYLFSSVSIPSQSIQFHSVKLCCYTQTKLS